MEDPNAKGWRTVCKQNRTKSNRKKKGKKPRKGEQGRGFCAALSPYASVQSSSSEESGSSSGIHPFNFDGKGENTDDSQSGSGGDDKESLKRELGGEDSQDGDQSKAQARVGNSNTLKGRFITQRWS